MVEARGDGCFASCLLDDRTRARGTRLRTNFAKNDYQSFFTLVALLGFNSPQKQKTQKQT